MIRKARSNPARFLTRAALGAALVIGVTVGTGVVAPDAAYAQKAPKLKFSKPFLAAAQPAQAAVTALAAGDAAGATAAKALVDAAIAAATVPDDQLMAGQLLVSLGGKGKKPEYQRQGLDMMIASGKADPAILPQLLGAAGQLAYQSQDFATAEKHLVAAIAAGNNDATLKVLLGETYIANKQVPKGMELIKTAISSSKASGQPAPESWYRRGLASAFKAGAINDAADFGAMFIRDYPKSTNVGIAATIVRELGNFGAQETLDLMRLMDRSKSYAETRDYVEHIQAADPRRLPGETLDVIAQGIATGKLRAADVFIADAKTQATGRLAADKASLAGYEADARKPTASETTISGAADTLLSYGKPAVAEQLYTAALTKAGVDANRTLTRLGIAQLDQGKFAEAQATLAKVVGPRQSIAKLWAAYAAGKASAPATPPVAAVTPK
jgi:tetratricopeptide (TPR) repeat protein